MRIGVKPSWAVHNKCIFVVEPDEIVRSALQFMLHEDNAVHAFAGLVAALAAGRRRKPDLVLLGLGLAQAHGPDVVGDIAGQLPGAKILVVADSPDDPLARACLAAGADDVLGKPIAVTPVNRKIDGLLGAGHCRP